MNGDEDQNKVKEEVSGQIFGEPIEDSELAPDEITPSEDLPVESVNPDTDYSGEAMSGISSTLSESEKETNNSPNLTSDDIDADWQDATATEETSMGDNPTPDQNQVDAISEPWGTSYKDNQELDVQKKARVLEQDREDDENK